MPLFLGFLFILLTAWLIWVPWNEYRHAAANGAHRVPFSRMLLRYTVAFCIFIISLTFLFSGYLLQGKSHLYQILYWMAPLGFALVMLVSAFLELLLIRRDQLLGERELLRTFIRPTDPARTEPERPSGEGRQPFSPS